MRFKAEIRVRELGKLMGLALTRALDRASARMIFDGKTYLRSRRLFGVTTAGVRVRYDDETNEWVPR